jgi:hypothetical protein
MHRRRHSGSIDKVRIELEGLLLLALFISKEGCGIGCCIGHGGGWILVLSVQRNKLGPVAGGMFMVAEKTQPGIRSQG